MKRITTNTTLEQSAFPVRSANVSTAIAGLASVVTVDKNDILAKNFSLVLDEAQELSCAPVSNEPSGLLVCFSLPFHAFCSQLFKGDSITILVNNCFTNDVVCVSDEPSFSSCQLLQMPLGRRSACSLKATLQILISPLDFTKFSAIKKRIITCHGWLINSPINPDYILDLSTLWSGNINNYVNENSALLCFNPCRSGIVKIVFAEISWYFDCILFSSCNCADANHFGFWKEPESIMIQSDTGILLFIGLLLELEPFEHITSLVTHSSHKTAVKLRMFLPDFSISELVQSGLVESLMLQSDIDAFLTGLIAQPNCAYQILVTDDLSPYCNIHNNPLKHNYYIYVVFLCSYENQKNKTCNLQHQLSSSVVSKISQESIDGRAEGIGRSNNERSLSSKGLGDYQLISPARPHAHFHFSTSNLQSNVCCQGFEGNNSSQGNEGTSFCKEILESKLLCRHGRNSNRADYSKIYSRTRNEVTVLIHHRNKIAVSPQHTNYGI